MFGLGLKCGHGGVRSLGCVINDIRSCKAEFESFPSARQTERQFERAREELNEAVRVANPDHRHPRPSILDPGP
eukprot:3931966-Rhodomonas_salina.1